MSINTDNLAQSLLCSAVLRFCHGVFYSHNHSTRLNVDSIYGRNKNIGFPAPIFTKLNFTQHLVLKSFCAEFFSSIGTKNVLSRTKISSVPISKVRPSPYRFSRKSHLIKGINWRSRVTNCTHIGQEIPKVHAGIHLRLQPKHCCHQGDSHETVVPSTFCKEHLYRIS